MLRPDNATRWNSTYLSLERALRCRTRIEHFSIDYRKQLGKNYLDPEDWTVLERMFEDLQVFYHATLRLEGHGKKGHHGSIWEALPVLEALLEKMEEGRGGEQNSRRGRSIRAMCHQNAWEKLVKYYNLTDCSHSIYATALLLHPQHRKNYFDRHWIEGEAPQWKEVMIKSVKERWQKEYRANPPQLNDDDRQQQRPPTFIDHFLLRHQAIEDRDAFDAYIEGPRTFLANEDNVFQWFNNPANPHLPLRDFAFDVLSIPAMSAEIERIFSTAKRLITTDRAALTDETVEILLLLKYWWDHKIVLQRRE